jgi:hypothetical protein
VICDAPLVATLTKHRTITAMPTTTTTDDAWPPERLDRLARGMFPVVFGRPAPTPQNKQGVPVVGVPCPAHSLSYRPQADDRAQR